MSHIDFGFWVLDFGFARNASYPESKIRNSKSKIQMKLEHKIGQLLLIGLPGPQLDLVSRSLLQDIQPGGILLNKHNIVNAQQVVELTSTIRSLIDVPPIIAVDQEGGRVDRLKEIFSPMPSADLFRASGDAAVAARHGRNCRRGASNAGIQCELCAGARYRIRRWSQQRVERTLSRQQPRGSSPACGCVSGGLAARRSRRSGQAFSGTGAAAIDSHSELPTIDRPRDEILKQEIAPYTELFSKINARLNAVIVAHAHYPAFDGPPPLPSSLSKNIVTGLLREELGFKGLAITDDLEMQAISSNREVPEAAVMAIEAGMDMVMVADSHAPGRATAAWDAMVKAANDGRITSTHIGRAFDHIARIKSMLSPPQAYSEQAIARLRERIGELNLTLQHSK